MTCDLYRVTATFPTEERFGLTSQLRRASISIESNIAEGCGRRDERELLHFLNMAAGSTSEVECQILVTRDLGYLSKETANDFETRTTEVRKMLFSFIQTLEVELKG